MRAPLDEDLRLFFIVDDCLEHQLENVWFAPRIGISLGTIEAIAIGRCDEHHN